MEPDPEALPLEGVSALVLGAGLGTRLRPLTDTVPKPVVPVLGRPLIGYPLIRLYAAGCREVFVNVHHQPERLQAVLDSWVQRRLLRMRLRWSVEQPEVLGTGGALRRLEAELCGRGLPFLLLNGDSLVDVPLADLWASHARARASGALATLVCIPHPEAERYGAVRVSAEGRILSRDGLGRLRGVTDEELAAATPCVFCGVHAIEPAVVASLPPDGVESCIVRQGYVPLLEAGADLRAFLLPPDALFHDVGTPGRYLDAQDALLAAPELLPTAPGVDSKEALFQEAAYAVDDTGREYGSREAVQGIEHARIVPPVFFGPRNVLGRGATVGPRASLGALNRVGEGATVERAALWSQVEVPAEAAWEGVVAAKLGGVQHVVSEQEVRIQSPQEGSA